MPQIEKTTKEKLLEEFGNLIKRVEGDLDCIDAFIGITKEELMIKKYQDFLSKAIDQTREETIREVDTNISKLLQKVADSPLNKRLNGWDALLELRKSLLPIILSKKYNTNK